MVDKKETVKKTVDMTILGDVKGTPHEPNEKTERYTAHIRTMSIEDIPKSKRTKTGEYSEITESVKICPAGQAIYFDVPKRTTANGIQKHFKKLGYVITTRKTTSDENDKRVTVWISKTVSE